MIILFNRKNDRGLQVSYYGGEDFAVLADGALVEWPGGGALAVDGAAGHGEPLHPPELDPVVAKPFQVRRSLERALHPSSIHHPSSRVRIILE
jgi:hypothetical protein